MTRTVAREISVQLGYSLADKSDNVEEVLESFFDKEYYTTLGAENELFVEYPGKKQLEYIKKVVEGALRHRDELDAYIEKYSKGWKISRISRTALAILRTALFEVLYLDDVPDSVAINEAVELSKGYEDQETVSFINGILGSFMRGERGAELLPDRENEAPSSSES
ncbi:MAG: transcription antitermination factor NusB [Oscillospiraceae bacterium]|nr:transcription antitermination factor NusB [Oscillospiraceae bacterium]